MQQCLLLAQVVDHAPHEIGGEQCGDLLSGEHREQQGEQLEAQVPARMRSAHSFPAEKAEMAQRQRRPTHLRSWEDVNSVCSTVSQNVATATLPSTAQDCSRAVMTLQAACTRGCTAVLCISAGRRAARCDLSKKSDTCPLCGSRWHRASSAEGMRSSSPSATKMCSARASCVDGEGQSDGWQEPPSGDNRPTPAPGTSARPPAPALPAALSPRWVQIRLGAGRA